MGGGAVVGVGKVRHKESGRRGLSKEIRLQCVIHYQCKK